MGMPFKNVIKIMSFTVFSIISLATLSFSFYKLSGTPNDADKTLYMSLITSIIGIYTPSPVNMVTSLKKTEDTTSTDTLFTTKRVQKNNKKNDDVELEEV